MDSCKVPGAFQGGTSKVHPRSCEGSRKGEALKSSERPGRVWEDIGAPRVAAQDLCDSSNIRTFFKMIQAAKFEENMKKLERCSDEGLGCPSPSSDVLPQASRPFGPWLDVAQILGSLYQSSEALPEPHKPFRP